MPAGFYMLLMFIAAAAVPSARADMWTNAAGRSIEAKLVDGDARKVVLERPDGARLTLSLQSLSPGSRKSAEAQLDKFIPSALAKPSPAAVAAKRVQLLHEAGQLSDAELQAIRSALPPN